jgi:iron only hydrogenase large subunit-like protein
MVSGLEGGGRIYVASVSPQTRANLAAIYGVSERVAGYMIQQLLSGDEGLRSGGRYGNGFEWVVDTNIGREACLVLSAEEVTATIRSRSGTTIPSEGGASTSLSTKPILTSSCPGWICYAEKTHPHILPHLSRLKSPQALMGTLVKTILSRKLGISPDKIWHVAIMPCFDKKLEASREELTDVYWQGSSALKSGIRDVDCVITSKELLTLADTRGINFAALPRTRLPPRHSNFFPDPLLYDFLFSQSPKSKANANPAAGTSGGNLYFTLQYIASQYQGSSIQTVRGRNADIIEYTLVSSTGEPLLKAARYYGFRNIQNLVRRLKPASVSHMPGGRPVGSARKLGGKLSKVEYAYVEVMACPGGCTNGGGQIKIDDAVVGGRLADAKLGPQEQKQWLAAIDEAYFSSDESENIEYSNPKHIDYRGDLVDGISPSYIKDTLAHWSAITGIDQDRLVNTSYRAVVSDVGKGKDNDMKRVVELAGKVGGGW